jgi:HEAT repeats/Bacterial Ig-like domain
MKHLSLLPLAAFGSLVTGIAFADNISLQSAPPVVIKTVPQAGSVGIDPALTELQVTFSKPMQDGSWSWSTWGEDTFPKMTGEPHYQPDGRTCVLPVKLEPGRFYATWLNSDQFHNFKDLNSQPATPYLLTFETAGTPQAAPIPGAAPLLNADQRQVLEWTDRSFRGLLDARTFDDWSAEQRTDLETRLLKTLEGEPDEAYYRAISSLAALRSQKAVPPLLAIAADRREKDNRDRWLAVRALGLLGDKKAVPDLIHLVYHYNGNTRWWAQISLVRLTGANFAKDWKAWGKWWNEQRGQPAWRSEFVRWLDDSQWGDPVKIEACLTQADLDFLGNIRNQ